MFFLTFFFFSSSDSSTSSDTCSETTCFLAGFVDGAGLVGVLVDVLAVVLVDLRAGFFFLTVLSTVSSSKGSTIGGPKLQVRGRDKGAFERYIG